MMNLDEWKKLDISKRCGWFDSAPVDSANRLVDEVFTGCYTGELYVGLGGETGRDNVPDYFTWERAGPLLEKLGENNDYSGEHALYEAWHEMFVFPNNIIIRKVYNDGGVTMANIRTIFEVEHSDYPTAIIRAFLMGVEYEIT